MRVFMRMGSMYFRFAMMGNMQQRMSQRAVLDEQQQRNQRRVEQAQTQQAARINHDLERQTNDSLCAIPVARKQAAGRNPGTQWPIATTDPDSTALPPKVTSFGAPPGLRLCIRVWLIAYFPTGAASVRR
jgi:hypothetical protein